jgi:hypothetical protein
MKPKIKIRKSWGEMSPVTKRIGSKKKYSRKQTKRDLGEE